MPRNAAAARNITQLVERNSRSRSRCRSTIGRVVRSSTRTNTTRSAAPLTQVAMTVGDDHDCSGPTEMPYINSPSPAPPSTNPGTSKRPASITPVRSRNRDAEDDRGDADGQVDEEHPAPGEVGDQETAQHGADGGRQRGPEGDEAGRPDPFGRREDPVEHGHPDGGHHAAARTLDDAEEHQLGHVLGQTAQRRAEGEDDDGGQEDPLAPEAVAQPARRRDEHGQAHQIGDHDAVHGGRRNVEVAPDGGERDVHDRDVHDVHEHRRHEDDADGDLLVHANDGHVLSLFDGLRAKRVRRSWRVTAPPGCVPRPYSLVPAFPRPAPTVSGGPLPGRGAAFGAAALRRLSDRRRGPPCARRRSVGPAPGGPWG